MGSSHGAKKKTNLVLDGEVRLGRGEELEALDVGEHARERRRGVVLWHKKKTKTAKQFT